MEYKGYRVVELDNDGLAAHYMNEDKNDYLENEYIVITQNGKVVDKRVYQKGRTRELRAFKIGDMYTDIWKPKNVEQSLAFDLVEDDTVPVKLLTGRYGSGKAQPVDTPIPTPDGWRKLGELKEGDFVFDRQGKPTKILKVFPQGKKENYQLTFSDGRVSYCNDEHIWSCVSGGGSLVPYTVKEMMEEGLKDDNGQFLFNIPICGSVELPKRDFLIDPYAIGAFMAKKGQIREDYSLDMEEDVVSEMAKALKIRYKKEKEKLQLAYEVKDIYGRSFISPYTEEDFPFEALQKLGEEERIPKNYLIGSIEQRKALLHGIMDAAGIVNQYKGELSYSTQNKQLAKDIRGLCHSLGLAAEIVSTKENYRYVYKVVTNISITEKKNLLRAKNKKEKANVIQSTSQNKTVAITDIHKMKDKVKMVCILVDNDEHLYLTNDYLVTHNTGILCKAGVAAVREEKFHKLLWVRNNIEVKDTNPLGSLPGDLLQKMWWTAGPLIDHCGGEFGLQRLIEEGKVEVAYLGHLRGRDIRNSLIICSEAENMTKQHLQLLLGRIGEGSQLWLDADLRQRDRLIFEKTEGIENLIEKLKGNPLFGYIHLEKTERSETACLADLLDG